MSVPRSVLEQALREGGTVLLSGNHPRAGTIIRHIAELPSELEFAAAAGDEERRDVLLAQMEADIAAKTAELETLRAQLGAAPTGAENPPAPAPKPESGDAGLRARLEALTIAELRAEAEAAGIVVPASVDRKAELVDFLLDQAKE